MKYYLNFGGLIMFNFIKRLVVRFLVSKYKLVSNNETGDHFVVVDVSFDGHVILMTQFKSYMHVSYSILKKFFSKAHSVSGVEVVGIEDDIIVFSNGERVSLADVNEPLIEESIDSF